MQQSVVEPAQQDEVVDNLRSRPYTGSASSIARCVKPLPYRGAMTERPRVSKVFVPGRLPEFTYNPRAHLRLEEGVVDFIEERGAILTVAGPTKTGKTVLLERVVEDPAWIDSQGIDSVEVLWARLADKLTLWSSLTVSDGASTTGTAKVGVEAALLPSILKLDAGGEYSGTDERNTSFSINRPLASLVTDALVETGRPVVIDDFHFVDRRVQREIVRALKPLVLHDVPIILVSISHRLRDVVSAEPDMGGRVRALDVEFWSEGDLQVVARKGFEALNFADAGEAIGHRLSRESYGSPHLMQQFCRELCKSNGLREGTEAVTALTEPADWGNFFGHQLDEASRLWFTRLLRGPQERGARRTKWPLKRGGTLDGYGLTLAALAESGPRLEQTKDEIKMGIDELVAGQAPAANQTTRVLLRMSAIAAKRADEAVPTEEELDDSLDEDRLGIPDTQPVVEYMDEGPNSKLHIADPFFAFFVKWGSGPILMEASAGGDRGEPEIDSQARLPYGQNIPTDVSPPGTSLPAD